MQSELRSYKNLGITLIALVVTKIVVLLILAGITINMLFSENGIITKAKQAAEETTKKAEEDETAGMQNMVDQMDEIIDSINKEPEVTLESLMTTTSDKNETVEDAYGNKIVVPAGFRIVAHGTDNVEYTYNEENGTSTNIPVVQDGIVIENEEDGTLPTPAQVASTTDYDTPVPIWNYYFEVSSDFTGATAGDVTYGAASEYGNTNAYNLQEWISTTLNNGGYYIARFEASQNGEKAASKAGQTVWNSINQPNAAIAAKSRYSAETGENKDNYYSDLMNSYAWDTAIIFIEAYADSTYSGKNNSTSFTTTGTNNDKVCNIHDMSGNAYEWTTETSASSDETNVYPCVFRAGFFNTSSSAIGGYTRARSSSTLTGDYGGAVTFRLLLCVK